MILSEHKCNIHNVFAVWDSPGTLSAIPHFKCMVNMIGRMLLIMREVGWKPDRPTQSYGFELLGSNY